MYPYPVLNDTNKKTEAIVVWTGLLATSQMYLHAADGRDFIMTQMLLK
jgi:hypothetical protein